MLPPISTIALSLFALVAAVPESVPIGTLALGAADVALSTDVQEANQ